jgi:hypothetical protein
MRHILSIICLACAGSLGACTGLEPALIGAAVGAADTSVTLINRGSVRFAKMVEFDEMIAAVELAISDLALTVVEQENGETEARYILADDRDSRMTLRLYRRTERLTYGRIFVGSFGTNIGAQLVIARIDANLPPPETPHDAPGDDEPIPHTS